MVGLCGAEQVSACMQEGHRQPEVYEVYEVHTPCMVQFIVSLVSCIRMTCAASHTLCVTLTVGAGMPSGWLACGRRLVGHGMTICAQPCKTNRAHDTVVLA